jgi:hypothetical protein
MIFVVTMASKTRIYYNLLLILYQELYTRLFLTISRIVG